MSDGVIDLGEGVARFKNLYLSGGVYLGGTGAANKLDDYEEGTWTPTFDFITAGDLSVTYSVQQGTYTKIGNLVEVHLELSTSVFTHTTASGTFIIRGLPFTAGDDAGASVNLRGWTKANYTSTGFEAEQGTTVLYSAVSGSGQASASLTVVDMPTTAEASLKASLTYRV